MKIATTRRSRQIPLVYSFLALGAVLVLSPSPCHAAPITVPTGLSPGDQYYLAFVTSGTRDATSTNIADYDTFVNAQADGSGYPDVAAITWRAIGSTPTVNANVHLGLLEYPIYLLDGVTKVADGASDMWDGSLDAPINLTEAAGSPVGTLDVWTGTNSAGRPVGPSIGVPTPRYGLRNAVDFNWTNNSTTSYFEAKRIYAVSVLQAVPVPEPTSLAVWAALFSGVAAYGLKRRRSHRGRQESVDPALTV